MRKSPARVKPTVPLFNAIPGDTLADRVTLCDAVGPAAPFSVPGAVYADWSIVPLPPWRAATTAELAALTAGAPPADYRSAIGLLRLPEALLAPFARIGLDRVRTREAYYAAIQSPAGNEAVAGVVEFVKPRLAGNDEFRIIRIFNEPGLNSTAYIHEKDRYVGLHVDNLRDQPIQGRGKSANRISINLGTEDRYLLFVSLTMDDLIAEIDPPTDCHPDTLVLKFLAAYPDTPVVRVKLGPGEAYIAPTQNVIHDGIGSVTRPDFNLTICGHIRLQA